MYILLGFSPPVTFSRLLATVKTCLQAFQRRFCSFRKPWKKNISYWKNLETMEKSSLSDWNSDPVKISRCGKTVFHLKISSCWPCRPLKRPFCALGVRAWGHSCKLLGWGYECKIFAPHLATFFFRRKEVIFLASRPWKWPFWCTRGEVVGSRVPTFGCGVTSAHFLHHEWRRVSSKSHE